MYAQLLPTEIFLYNHRILVAEHSATARAIDEGAPWPAIAACAVQEGYDVLAEGLLTAYEALLRQGV